MKKIRLIGAGALLCIATIGAVHAAEDIHNSLEVRRKQLDSLIAEQWEYTLRTFPEMASMIGDKRYNDRLSDFSQLAIDANNAADAAFLKRFQAIDTTGFPVQEALNQKLMVRTLQMNLDGVRFKEWEMPVSQTSGIHIDAAQIVPMLTFETVKDYEDYLARLQQLPIVFDQTIVQMRNGMRDHLMPPQFLIPKIARQAHDIAALAPDASPFAEPLQRFPAAVSLTDRTRLRSAILAAITHEVAPAYQKFSEFTAIDYAPLGRKEVGLWALPDGAARYRYQVRQSTTTEQTPEQIHQIGLSEVRRIETLMTSVAAKLGYPDQKSFQLSLANNPAVHPVSRQALLDLYRKYTDQMYQQLPQLFTVMPKSKIIIAQIETFREQEASAAQYNSGTPDGSRPGRVMINTGDFAKRTTIGVETTALHEGVPGHHMQISIAQEQQNLPPFRQQGNYTAFAEGWALYAERLGEERGFYSDPYSNYGHLQDEMLRAIRLVVDTGLHDRKWTRQQVVDFFHAHSGIDEVDVQSETDRYIVWPGQALGYKIGQLKILALRDYAKEQLGDRFDLRAFHDEVLGAGALPMDVLEARIREWVTACKAG